MKTYLKMVYIYRDEETTMLEKDDIYILRYNVVRDLLLGGNVELI